MVVMLGCERGQPNICMVVVVGPGRDVNRTPRHGPADLGRGEVSFPGWPRYGT
ncbi:MAG TPA: hypothetical protein PK801_08570 [Aggregatilineales bacterium]|nr:hypothetical protein [Aggregatilineales bacterium]HQA68362.1 hypothetical protein [Aggregatilineales bacterium]